MCTRHACGQALNSGNQIGLEVGDLLRQQRLPPWNLTGRDLGFITSATNPNPIRRCAKNLPRQAERQLCDAHRCESSHPL
jgi:hypothetical protein